MVEPRRVYLNAEVKGKPALRAQVDVDGEGLIPVVHLVVEAPISYQDWLLLSGSTKDGLQLEITPVKQPLPMDDEGQWDVPKAS